MLPFWADGGLLLAPSPRVPQPCAHAAGAEPAGLQLGHGRGPILPHGHEVAWREEHTFCGGWCVSWHDPIGVWSGGLVDREMGAAVKCLGRHGDDPTVYLFIANTLPRGGTSRERAPGRQGTYMYDVLASGFFIRAM